MKKILVVVDMQNDFVDGALGSLEAQKIVPAVCEKIKNTDADEIFVTFDTHYENYMATLEGEKLPVPHCIEGTDGHRLNAEVEKALSGKTHTDIIKNTFGTFEIAGILKNKYAQDELSFEFIGLCTDICVVSNALIMRANYPDSRITVDSACCAGVSVETHYAALATMKCCQIDVI